MASLAQQIADLQRQVRKLQAQNSGQAGPATAGVSSFNSRRGYVTLTLADLTALLTYVASFNGRSGAVTLTAADITAATGLLSTQVGAASGVAGLDGSSRLQIPAGVGAPSTGTGAIGVGTLVGWIPIVIGGVQSKIPIFQ